MARTKQTGGKRKRNSRPLIAKMGKAKKKVTPKKKIVGETANWKVGRDKGKQVWVYTEVENTKPYVRAFERDFFRLADIIGYKIRTTTSVRWCYESESNQIIYIFNDKLASDQKAQSEMTNFLSKKWHYVNVEIRAEHLQIVYEKKEKLSEMDKEYNFLDLKDTIKDKERKRRRTKYSVEERNKAGLPLTTKQLRAKQLQQDENYQIRQQQEHPQPLRQDPPEEEDQMEIDVQQHPN